MQQTRIAAFGITLAISSVAAWAAPGDAWHGTYKDEDKVERPALEATPSRPDSTALREQERFAAPLAREEYEYQRRESAVELPPQGNPHHDRRHPNTGQLIERGRFNRTGPNDFGA